MRFLRSNRYRRNAVREAVEEAIQERTTASTAAKARARLARPDELDYIGAAETRDIQPRPSNADAIANAYLDLVDE